MKKTKKMLAVLLAAVMSCSGIYGVNTTLKVQAEEVSSDFIIEDGVLTGYQGEGGAVVIPEGVTSIGEDVFYNCKTITSVVIPEGVTSIGEGEFAYCSNLTSVTIPDTVTNIGDRAFYNCGNLTSIVIPEGVTNIGSLAFWNCGSLENVTLPDSVTNIGVYAFAETKWLKNQQSDNSLVIVNNMLIDGRSCSGSVDIPNYVTSIGEQAFSGCSSITRITIPDSVTSIANSAFMGCSSLESIVIPKSVTSIEYYTFNGCSNLTDVTIPSSITNIGRGAFIGTKWLSNKQAENPLVMVNNILIDGTSCTGDVVIPDGVVHFEEEVFANSKVTSITIPASVTRISTSPGFERSNIIIKGYKGSYVEEQAKTLEYNFVRIGELENVTEKDFYNVDGKEGITLSDAQMILKYALKIMSSNVKYILADAQTCLKIALKIIPAPTDELADWIVEYKNIVQVYDEKYKDASYDLIYIDEDDVPELVILTLDDYGWECISMYTYKDGDSHALLKEESNGSGNGDGSYGYIPKQNVVYTYYKSYAGAEFQFLYKKIEDGELKDYYGEPLISRQYIDLNNDGGPDVGEYTDDYHYFYGDKEITADEFDSYRFEGDIVWIAGSKSCEDILSQLNNGNR